MRRISILCTSIIVLCMLAGACSASFQTAEVTTVPEIENAASVDQSVAPDEMTATAPELHLDEPKALVAFFSETGRTKAAAEGIAEQTHAKLFQIEPDEPYTEADRDYEDENSRSNKEHQDQKARPATVSKPDDIRQYDIVYLGYPIWYGSAPRIISTFLEENDLSGIKVVPFCTSGGTSITASEEELRAQFPNIDWQPGKRIEDPEQDTKKAEWAEELGFWPFGE